MLLQHAMDLCALLHLLVAQNTSCWLLQLQLARETQFCLAGRSIISSYMFLDSLGRGRHVIGHADSKESRGTFCGGKTVQGGKMQKRTGSA